MSPKLPNSDVCIIRKFERNNSRGFIWLQNVSEHRSLEIGIFLTVALLLIFVLNLVLFLKHPLEPERDAENSTNAAQNQLSIVSRLEWQAQLPASETTPLKTPVPYVIVHHTDSSDCFSQTECSSLVRSFQKYHIENAGWADIGYNFLVGGDGSIYMGRGWTVQGAHLKGWNNVSIGIAFIGSFISRPPADIQLASCQKLIGHGIDLGYIWTNYTLLGAKQLSATESPGIALFDIIKTWSHWKDAP